MKISNEEQLKQDLALRQALLEILPDLALKNGISPSVTEAMAGRLQLPTLNPAFVPEDTLPPEDASSDGGEPEEALLEELLPPPQRVERFEAQLASISEQLRQLAEVEDAEQKELAALRRDLEGFSPAAAGVGKQNRRLFHSGGRHDGRKPPPRLCPGGADPPPGAGLCHPDTSHLDEGGAFRRPA